jgi:RNA polymerase sigma-70 factor (ECF subfamily)
VRGGATRRDPLRRARHPTTLARIRSDADDRELVAAAQQGDRAALDVLLRRHYDRIHAVCRRVIGSARDADDAAQEALIKIVRGLHGYDERASFATWAYRVATNAALDELRRRGRRPLLHVVDDDGEPHHPEIADATAHARIDAVADHEALDESLRDLPEEFRVAVVLRDVADLDYAEIARVLGVPVGTVKSRIARGRAMLADRLGNRSSPRQRPTPEP